MAKASATVILSSGTHTSPQRIFRETQAAMSLNGSTGQ